MFDYERFDKFDWGGLDFAPSVGLLRLAPIFGGVGVWLVLLSVAWGGEPPVSALSLLAGGILRLVLGLQRVANARR